MSELRNSYPSVAQQGRKIHESPVTLVSAGEIVLPITPELVHSFAGVVFYNDPNGDTPLDPSGLTGTSTVTVKTSNQPHGFQVVPDNALDASTFVQTSWDANVLEVKCVFAAIVGATHARLIVSSNKT